MPAGSTGRTRWVWLAGIAVAVGGLALLGVGVRIVTDDRGAAWPGASIVAELAAPVDPAEPLHDQSGNALLELLAAERDPMARRRLIDQLAGLPDGLELLREVWSSTADGAAREQALIAASQLGSADAALWLASIASHDEKFGARAGAALGTIDNPGAAPALAELLSNRESTLVRANAARALGSSGSPAQAPALASLVENSGEALRVRQEAALSLGRIGDVSMVGTLVDTLEATSADRSGQGEQLRISVVRALGGIGTAEARAAMERYGRLPISETERAFLARAMTTGR